MRPVHCSPAPASEYSFHTALIGGPAVIITGRPSLQSGGRNNILNTFGAGEGGAVRPRHRCYDLFNIFLIRSEEEILLVVGRSGQNNNIQPEWRAGVTVRGLGLVSPALHQLQFDCIMNV